jgi:hypothetical protein
MTIKIRPRNIEDYLDRPLKDALLDGLVAQVTGKPFITCGSISPESQTPCELYPGHNHAHSGQRGLGRVSWATVEMEGTPEQA